jgi:4-amino-4-deoxy-L-arabinose transferase-like glycosyltransferase
MATTLAGSERHPRGSGRSLATFLEFAVRTPARGAIVLALVTLLNILPGFFSIPPTDRDESRFAQATKQMIESGDYIDIRFQETTRYKKPVGIYWLQAVAVRAGDAVGVRNAHTKIWLYRIPSLIGAVGAVLLTYWAALAFVTRRAALLAGLMMATCILLGVEGRLAKTDAMLLLTAVAVMGALARLYLPEQRRHLDATSSWTIPAILWTALAAGVLLKGPLVPMLAVLAIGTLCIADRSASWLHSLRPVVGLIWLAALVLPWFFAIVGKSGDGFFAESVGQDLLSKLFRGQESHGAPPGYYAVLFWLTFWPGAILAGLAAPAVWAARREPGAKFLLAWIVPAWIVFEIVVTKLPHYVLPLYPAIAILIAGVVDTRMLTRKPWLERGTIGWFLVPLVIGILGLVALLFVGRQFGLLVWPVVGAAVVAGLAAWQLYSVDAPEWSLLRAAGASILMSIAIFGLVVPRLVPAFPSATLVRVLHASGCSAPLAASAGYGEPSLVFLAGTATRLTDGAGAAEFLRGGECRFAFVDARQERNFAQRAEAIGLRYTAGPRIEGYNLGNTRTSTISIYRSGGPS